MHKYLQMTKFHTFYSYLNFLEFEYTVVSILYEISQCPYSLGYWQLLKNLSISLPSFIEDLKLELSKDLTAPEYDYSLMDFNIFIFSKFTLHLVKSQTLKSESLKVKGKVDFDCGIKAAKKTCWNGNPSVRFTVMIFCRSSFDPDFIKKY
ncbi:hypothetical protein BpHYR1_017030 [Brachionus plicatilis]|uniref:Uncharacterized protein n=1 Tax=Brachionus plicatilis TaxID=10195 RepID=A0A3M7QNK9_BRAPC|nr:hypothetical protein BpHYR1_017030 [Brachionus plicatilis]